MDKLEYTKCRNICEIDGVYRNNIGGKNSNTHQIDVESRIN